MNEKMTEPFDPDEISRLIRSRRSVFTSQFVPGKKIPDHIIEQILENANWAPNHKHTEPWRFMVFSGEGLKKLAHFQSELYRRQAGAKFKEDKFLKLQKNPLLCSHIISLGMKRSVATEIPETEEISAVACAVQNIYLSVTAFGLGGYWTTGGITYMDEAKDFFHLDPPDRLLGFFYLGYVQTPSAAGRRGDITLKTIWVRE